jgi:hypothetical protein
MSIYYNAKENIMATSDKKNGTKGASSSETFIFVSSGILFGIGVGFVLGTLNAERNKGSSAKSGLDGVTVTTAPL